MKKITHSIYNNYPEQPYISSERDLELWQSNPELFPYAIIERKQMIRLEEGLLPGDIIMLWRIHFNNFTNESSIPQYFEYKYGVDSTVSINTLIDLKYVDILNATDSLPLLNMDLLKRILINNNLKTSGKKNDLLVRITNNIKEDDLKQQFTLRQYVITSSGKELLSKYDSLVKKHGAKF